MRSIFYTIALTAGLAVAIQEGLAAASAADANHYPLVSPAIVRQSASTGANPVAVSVPLTPVALRVSVANGWRYRWYNGRWWYWLPENRWVYYNGNSWLSYAPDAQSYTDYFSPGTSNSLNYSYNYVQPYYAYPRVYPGYYGGYGPRVYARPRVYAGYRWRF